MFVFFLQIIIVSPVNAVINIMPLGDSITVGNQAGAVPDNNNYYIAYRLALWNKLVAAGYSPAVLDFVGGLQAGGSTSLPDPDHEGHVGEEADYIESNVDNWLNARSPDIILLHIGTNDILAGDDSDLTVAAVSRILDKIDQYETTNSVDITVVLALIINQWNYTCPDASATTDFNDKLYNMAWDRINNPVNPAYPDKIEIVDMECGAGIDYRPQASGGDMYINVHPNNNGYTKMADVWYTAVYAVTHPTADAGSNQSVSVSQFVTLDGSKSKDPDGSIATYQWTQTPVSTVVLSGSQSAKPTFIAPDVGPSGETLTFQLTITDNDGLQDTDTTTVNVLFNDNCPNDPNKTQPGICGCGIADTDSDGDGIPDCNDDCNNLIDSDGDGTNDCDDKCPNDPNKIEKGICGCSIADTDSDGDGTPDCKDANDDNDGLPDGEERGPNGNDSNYDGNGDGTADSLQGNVASFHTYDQQGYVTLESQPGTSISSCKAVDYPSMSDLPSDADFPYGVFNFTITGVAKGGATSVVMYFPSGATFDTYYKFGSTTNNLTNHWYEFLYDGQTGAEINGNVVKLYFVDGANGDDDLATNGIVVDDGAPAVVPASSGGTTVASDGGGGGGCFIATAAHESLMEPHVKILRDFRDRFLLVNKISKGFVNLYYTYSPPIADFIAKYDSLRAILRLSLLPVVGLSWVALKIDPALTVALMLSFISCFIGIVWFRRRYNEQ